MPASEVARAATIPPAASPPGRRSGLILIVLLAFAAALAVYGSLAAPTVLFGDSAELQTVGLRGGIPHSSGYPSFVLIGRLFALLPFPDPAFRITFMGAFFAAATVALLVLVLVELGLSGGAALAGALVLGTSFTFWHVALRAEVYSLALFLGFLALWRTLAALRRRDLRSGLLAALLLGFALTGHLMLAPAVACLGLTLAWHEMRSQPRPILALPAILLAFLLGLVPYLYLVWADTQSYAFNYLRLVELVHMPNGLTADFDTPWKRLVWLVTSRGLYPAVRFPFSLGGTARGVARCLSELTLFEIGPLALLLAAWGCVRLIRANPRPALVLVSVAGAALLFSGAIAAGTHMGIFLLPCTLACAIFVAAAFEPLINRSAALGFLALGLVVFAPHAIRIHASDHPIGRWRLRVEPEDPSLAPPRLPSLRGFRAPRLYGEQAIASIPRDALVIAEWAEFANLTYFRAVEGRRPDLTLQPLSPRLQLERLQSWQGSHVLARAPFVFLSRPPALEPADAPLDSVRLAMGRWFWIRRTPVAGAPRRDGG